MNTTPTNRIVQVTTQQFGEQGVERAIETRLLNLAAETGWTWNPIQISTTEITPAHQFGSAATLLSISILVTPYMVSEGK